MKPNYSLKVYPRLDSEFKKKDSLDFQRTLGNIYKQRPTDNKVQGYLWIAFLIIGLSMGIVAFLLDIIVEEVMMIRWALTQGSMSVHWTLSMLTIVVFSVSLVVIASSLTVYFAPTAMGSGVAEAMGYLNGVAYPSYVSIKALAVKFFGLALGVSAGMCGGKEGPLIHMGVIVGSIIPYLNFTGIFRYFRNDTEKRKLMAAGIAAGVSAAFGAPIGGSLFAYEMSKPNTFWSFSLTWKVFFAASMSTFTLTVLKQLYEGDTHIKLINSGNVKLASVGTLNIYVDTLFASAVIGILGGLVGSIFIRVNTAVNIIRKKMLTTNIRRVLEASLLIALTVSCFFVSALFQDTCIQEEKIIFNKDTFKNEVVVDPIFAMGIDVK